MIKANKGKKVRRYTLILIKFFLMFLLACLAWIAYAIYIGVFGIVLLAGYVLYWRPNDKD